MERISKQVQQLGVSQRPCVMWCIGLVLFMFGYGLSVWFVTQYVGSSEEQETSNISRIIKENNIYVIRLNESYKYGINMTWPSV